EGLRISGAAKAAKRGAEREAAAGLVASSGPALLELNSETDFVAKNEQFIALADELAAAAAEAKPADSHEFAEHTLASGKTVSEAISGLSAVIGEKIELGRVACLDGQIATYLHRRAADLPPAVGVLVEYEGEDSEVARAVAMQVAAMRPRYLTREEIPAEVMAKEKEIAEATALTEGKPDKALPKVIEGRLNGFYKDVVLLDQPWVQDGKRSVAAVLEEADVRVKRFAHIEVGA